MLIIFLENKTCVIIHKTPTGQCGGWTPTNHQAPTQLLVHFPIPSKTEKRIGYAKARKLVGQDRGGLIDEGKKKKKTSKDNHSPPSQKQTKV